MPTDNSGTARAAKLRRISASQGPVPPIRPNIGSQALDALLGRMDCCPTPNPLNPPNPCNPQLTWSDSPLQLTRSQEPGFVYYAKYATVISVDTFSPLFGQVTGYTPPNANITVSVKNSGDSWIVIFTSDIALSGSFTCLTAFTFVCKPPFTREKQFTFTV